MLTSATHTYTHLHHAECCCCHHAATAPTATVAAITAVWMPTNTLMTAAAVGLLLFMFIFAAKLFYHQAHKFPRPSPLGQLPPAVWTCRACRAKMHRPQTHVHTLSHTAACTCDKLFYAGTCMHVMPQRQLHHTRSLKHARIHPPIFPPHKKLNTNSQLVRAFSGPHCWVSPRKRQLRPQHCRLLSHAVGTCC